MPIETNLLSPIFVPAPSNLAASLTSSNNLLASLPRDEYDRLAPHLKRVPMRVGEVLYKQDAPLNSIYFPGGGACSLVKPTEDGHTLEIGVVGAEGAIGATVFCGLRHAPCDVIVQIAGPYADVLPAALLADGDERFSALNDRLLRYTQALLMQMMQATVCNCLHSAEKRCARWLLAAHDRAGEDEFRFTHEFAAARLGLRRPTVTLVAGALQAAGLIDNQRGRVKIVNREGLDAAACECYRAVQSSLTRLLPEPRRMDSAQMVQ